MVGDAQRVTLALSGAWTALVISGLRDVLCRQHQLRHPPPQFLPSCPKSVAHAAQTHNPTIRAQRSINPSLNANPRAAWNSSPARRVAFQQGAKLGPDGFEFRRLHSAQQLAQSRKANAIQDLEAITETQNGTHHQAAINPTPQRSHQLPMYYDYIKYSTYLHYLPTPLKAAQQPPSQPPTTRPQPSPPQQ